MTLERKPEPIPKQTINASFASGRTMSGRITISLASTVRAVIDAPVTHSCLNPLTLPAWTDAISSSRLANSSPFRFAMFATLGSTRIPLVARATTRTTAVTAPTPYVVTRPTADLIGAA